MRKRILILSTQFLICTFCSAQSSKEDCPKPPPSVFSILCSQAENQAAVSDETSPYNYLFEKTIEEMACVNRQIDNDSVIRVKVQTWWNKYHNDCHCNRANFVLADGNLLKYAAQQRFEEFFEILKKYKLDYNFVDPADGNTLLDFVFAEWQKAKDAKSDSQKSFSLKRIHDFLRKNGALYKRELK